MATVSKPSLQARIKPSPEIALQQAREKGRIRKAAYLLRKKEFARPSLQARKKPKPKPGHKDALQNRLTAREKNAIHRAQRLAEKLHYIKGDPYGRKTNLLGELEDLHVKPGDRISVSAREEVFARIFIETYDRHKALKECNKIADKDCASTTAAVMIGRRNVLLRMAQLWEQKARESHLRVEDVLSHMSAVCRIDHRKFVTISKDGTMELAEDYDGRAVKEVIPYKDQDGTTRFRVIFWDKMKGLEMYGRFLRMFGADGPVINAEKVQVFKIGDQEVEF